MQLCVWIIAALIWALMAEGTRVDVFGTGLPGTVPPDQVPPADSPAPAPPTPPPEQPPQQQPPAGHPPPEQPPPQHPPAQLPPPTGHGPPAQTKPSTPVPAGSPPTTNKASPPVSVGLGGLTPITVVYQCNRWPGRQSDWHEPNCAPSDQRQCSVPNCYESCGKAKYPQGFTHAVGYAVLGQLTCDCYCWHKPVGGAGGKLRPTGPRPPVEVKGPLNVTIEVNIKPDS